MIQQSNDNGETQSRKHDGNSHAILLCFGIQQRHLFCFPPPRCIFLETKKGVLLGFPCEEINWTTENEGSQMEVAAHRGQLLFPLIPSVNPFSSKFLFRNRFFQEKVSYFHSYHSHVLISFYNSGFAKSPKGGVL